MDNDPAFLIDLEPVRLRTSILERIDQLAEERRRLLQAMPARHDQRLVRGRLVEIERELIRLWDARRRELRDKETPTEPVETTEPAWDASPVVDGGGSEESPG